MTHQPLLQRIDIAAAVLGTLLALGLLTTLGPWWALSAAIGTVAGIFNFVALRRIVARLVAPGSDADARRAAGVLLGKFAMLGGLIYVLIVVVGLEPRALAAGITTVVAALLVESLRRPDLLSAAAPQPGTATNERTNA
jgi:hypothetical protein